MTQQQIARPEEINMTPDEIFFARIMRAVESGAIPEMECWNDENAANMLRQMKAAYDARPSPPEPSDAAVEAAMTKFDAEALELKKLGLTLNPIRQLNALRAALTAAYAVDRRAR